MKIDFKYIKPLFLLSCIFFYGCQPDGGDLTPVLQDGAKIVSTQTKTDTALQYDTEDFSIKVSGKWESLHGEVFCILVIKNRSQRKVKVDFNRSSVANTLDEKLKITLVSTANRKQTSQIIESKIAEIDKSETLAFGLNIDEKNDSYKGDVKYRGSKIWMMIPVIVEQGETFITKEFNFRFKYDDYHPETGYNESLID